MLNYVILQFVAANTAKVVCDIMRRIEELRLDILKLAWQRSIQDGDNGLQYTR